MPTPWRLIFCPAGHFNRIVFRYRELVAALQKECVMNRNTEDHSDLFDLGSIVAETKGPPAGTEQDLFVLNRAIGHGLSDD
jgi:hypothetical protein